MGQVLHACARTTEAVHGAIQLQQESVRTLAQRFGVSPTTVQKWRKRSTTADAPMGPKEPRVIAFRRHTLLPLDDCLYALQPVERMRSTPHLTRSTLHRCLERHGISRLPQVGGDKRPGSALLPISSATSTSTPTNRARGTVASVNVVEIASGLEVATAQAALGGSCRVSLVSAGLSISPMASTPM